MTTEKKKTNFLEKFVRTVNFTGGARLTSEQPFRRYIWLVTILVGCIACSCHLYFVVKEYQEFAVNTLVKNYEYSFLFPDITICTTVPFSRAKVLQNNGTGLPGATDFWEYIRKSMRFQLTSRERAYHDAVMSYRAFSRKDMYINILDNIIDCNYKNSLCNRLHFKWTRTPTRFNCLTFTPEYRDILLPDRKSGLRLIMSIGDGQSDNEPNTELLEAIGYEVILHEAGTLPPAGRDSVIVEPGTQVSIKLNMKNYTRLNTPTVKCIHEEDIKASIIKEFKGLSRENSKFKKYTESNCYSIRASKKYLDTCHCIHEKHEVLWKWKEDNQTFCHDIPKQFFFNDGITEDGILSYRKKSYDLNSASMYSFKGRMACVDKVYNTMHQSENIRNMVARGCPVRCSKSAYLKDVTFTKWPKSREAIKEILNSKVSGGELFKLSFEDVIKNLSQIDKMVSILIYPSDLSVDETSESLAYPLSQLFADFGGNIGLWIGVSLLTVAELIEFFIIIVLYCGGKSRKRFLKKRTDDTNGSDELNVQEDKLMDQA